MAAGDGRLVKDFVHQRFAADGVAVGDGFFACGGVDDHRDVAVDDVVHDVRAALRDFVHLFAGDALCLQVCGGAAGSDDFVTGGDEQARHFGRFVFVVVFDRDEDGAAGGGQAFARAADAFVEGFGEGGAESHDFAGGFHFWAEDGIDVAEFGKGEDGFFDGVEGRPFFVADALGGEGLSGHAARGDFGERPSGRFGDEWHGARGARVHFEDVDGIAFDGKLGVHESHHAEGAGECFGLRFDLFADGGGEAVGRQRAGGVAGVYARLFDVFHQAAKNDGFAVADDVDIDFDGIIKEAVEQDRRVGRDVERFFHVVFEVGVVVDDVHRPPAEDVGRAHDQRVADFLRLGEGFRGVGGGTVRRL